MQLFKNLIQILLITITMWGTSCASYNYQFNVGEGAQTGVEIKEKNHYFFSGLASGKTSDPVKMAGNEENFSVRVYHSFVDSLVTGLTLGIYAPTTTIVTK